MDGSAVFTAKPHFARRAIHEGYDPMDEQGALTPPIHFASTFAFETGEAAGRAFSGEAPAHFYTRVSNPTLDLLERRMASLEDGAAAVSFVSVGNASMVPLPGCGASLL